MAFSLSILAAIAILWLAVRPIAKAAPGWHMPRAARTLALAAGVGYGLLGRFVFGLAYSH